MGKENHRLPENKTRFQTLDSKLRQEFTLMSLSGAAGFLKKADIQREVQVQYVFFSSTIKFMLNKDPPVIIAVLVRNYVFHNLVI